MGAEWEIVVPVKDLNLAKSRLPLADDVRRGLALALALDTLRAISGVTHRVFVVTDPQTFAAILHAAPDLAAIVTEVPDPQTGLNGAIARGFASTQGPARAAIVGDLPALAGSELRSALNQVTPGSVRHVQDHEWIGTTLLAAVGAIPSPTFGMDSAAAHLAGGSVPIIDAGPGLRLDVDSVEDLVSAAGLGVGRRTSAWLNVVLAGATSAAPAHAQATLRTIGTPSTAFLDDGTVIEVTADPRWRPGQRITLNGSVVQLAGNAFGPTP